MAEKWIIRYWDNIINRIVWTERGFNSYEAAEDYGFCETCSDDALDYEIIDEH